MSALFETVRVTRGHVRLLDAHVARLRRSRASEIGVRGFLEAVEMACKMPVSDDFALRIDLDGNRVSAAPRPVPKTDPVHVVSVSGYEPANAARELKLADRGWADAAERGAGERAVVLVSRAGFVGEGTRANVFARIGGRFVTPPNGGILSGVTRGWVLSQIDVAVEPLALDALRNADAAFLTSALRGVVRVRSVDDHALGEDDAITRLALAWEQA